MNRKLEKIDKKINKAEESYRLISKAWISNGEVKSRIDALLELARELKAAESNNDTK